MSKHLELDFTGRFQVQPLEWWLRESAGGAVGVSIVFLVIACWEPHADDPNGAPAWQDWSEYGPYRTGGTFWVVKKDGSVNQSGVDQLKAVFGWDGNIGQFYQAVPEGVKAQIDVTLEEFKGQQSYRANWLYPFDAPVGGGAGMASEEKGREINNRFGSLLRAAASGGTGPAKPAPKPKGGDGPDDDLPF